MSPFFAVNELFEHVRLRNVAQAERFALEVIEFAKKGPNRRYLYVESLIVSSFAATFSGAPIDEVAAVVDAFWEAWDQVPDADPLPVLLGALRQLIHLIPVEEPDDTLVILAAKRYAEQNYHRRLELVEVAEHVGLSPSYFSHTFKQRAGMSFSHYLNILRLQRAMSLMADPALDISEVAYSVGYATLHYFTLMFRRFTGMTPTQYRQSLDTEDQDQVS